MEKRNPYHNPNTFSQNTTFNYFVDNGGIPPGSPEFLERERISRREWARRNGIELPPEPPTEPPPAE